MPISVRQDLRSFLVIYFTMIEDQTTIEECLNAYIIDRKLGMEYQLSKNELKTSKKTSRVKRLKLRDQVSQELGVMKSMGLIGRSRYGVYVPRQPKTL